MKEIFLLLVGLVSTSAFLAPALLIRRTAECVPAVPSRGLRPLLENGSRLRSRLVLAASPKASEQTGKVQEAIAKCRAAVARKPDNEEAWFLLGVLLQETGELEDAQAAFEMSTKLDPTREAGWLNLGLLAERRKEIPSALQAYMAALQANPSSASAYVRLGTLMESASKNDAAQAAYEKAISLEATDISGHVALCKLLLRLDRPDGARQAAERATASLPQAAAAHAQLGAALVQLTRPREAEKALRTAVELDPALSDAYNSLGIALKAQGKYADSEKAYKAAVQLAPDSPEPLYNLGIFYREQGALKDAKTTLEKALGMDPTNMDIRLMLAALEGGATDVELPPKYVESLFDSVAETYDDTILPAIAYNVPNELVTAVTKSMAFDCGCASGQLPANEWAVLDLGCGTGQSGAALRGTASVMAACDLSKAMCAVARRKGMYLTVAHADAVTFLSDQPPQAADLVIAGDVLPYIKHLLPLFKGAARVLKPAARFAFTTEEDVRERERARARASSPSTPTSPEAESASALPAPLLNSRTRFWHSQDLVVSVAEAAGFKVLVADTCSLHKQARDSKAVSGRVYVLQLAASPTAQ